MEHLCDCWFVSVCLQAQTLRKKASRVEDDNESLVLQLKKMATKARSMLKIKRKIEKENSLCGLFQSEFRTLYTKDLANFILLNLTLPISLIAFNTLHNSSALSIDILLLCKF